MSSPKINSQKDNDLNSSLSDLMSRIDERVKVLIEKQKELDVLTEKLSESNLDASHRLRLLENKTNLLEKDVQEIKDKVQSLHLKSEGFASKIGDHDNRWASIFDSVWKIALMCIAGFILYKLGIQAPPG